MEGGEGGSVGTLAYLENGLFYEFLITNFSFSNFETSKLISFKNVYCSLKNYELYAIFLSIGRYFEKPAYSPWQIKFIMDVSRKPSVFWQL